MGIHFYYAHVHVTIMGRRMMEWSYITTYYTIRAYSEIHAYAAADPDATITPTPAVSHNGSAWSFGCRPSAARREGPPAEAQRSEL